MGRRRNTAKTGDKSLYSNRPQKKQDVDLADNDDDMEFLSESEAESSASAGDNEEIRQVLDLGLGAGEQSSDDESLGEPPIVYHGVANPQDDESTPMHPPQNSAGSYSSDEDDDDDDDDSVQEALDREKTTNWGTQKSSYYSADTADIEIGQDEEDAFMEEEAARDVRDIRFEDMQEDDFSPPLPDAGISDHARQKASASSFDSLQSSTLSKSAKRQLMTKHYPDVMSMVSYFSQTVKDLESSTRVGVGALKQVQKDAEGLRKTPQGDQYVLTKSLLQGSIALGTVMYLLVMSKDQNNETEAPSNGMNRFYSHPVVGILKRLEKVLSASRFAEVEEQLAVLVKAASIVAPPSEEQEKRTTMEGASLSAMSPKPKSKVETNESGPRVLYVSNKQEEANGTTLTFNDAKFSLRPREVTAVSKSKVGRPNLTRKLNDCLADYGDSAVESKVWDREGFASTLNSIEQRVSGSKHKKKPNADDDYDAELGSEKGYQAFDGWEDLSTTDNQRPNPIAQRRKRQSSSDADGLSFYSAIENLARQKKAVKDDIYAVPPKYPGLEYEVSGERAVSRAILKNRGLVAHKARINRNPRVKKRVQYRKALIRRKGTVRGIRVDEGHKYGGEGTGIKSRISRSRKL